jgi:transposase
MVEMWAGLKSGRGIEVLPRRWVVELTFAWLCLAEPIPPPLQRL